jgi:hypothetical protein
MINNVAADSSNARECRCAAVASDPLELLDRSSAGACLCHEGDEVLPQQMIEESGDSLLVACRVRE